MNRPRLAVLCVFAGVAAIFVAAMIDYRETQGPWRDGFGFIGPMPDIPGLIPFIEYQPSISDVQFSDRSSHKILFIDFDKRDWDSIIAEGEIPKPGERTALAGVLCDSEEFMVRGETYRVSGRMHRDVGGLSTVYLVPHDSSVTEPLLGTDRVREGFYDPEARQRMSDPNVVRAEDIDALFIHDAIPMPPGVSYLVLFGLALTLYGGAVLQWTGVVWLHRVSNAFDGLVTASREHPSLFRFVHTLHYSTFLYVMVLGILSPQANLTASQWVFEQFSEGALKELGQAYTDGNVPLAAWETFRNNFVVQTFLLSTLPSIVVPLFGVGKTLLSLTLVGFAMAPVWSGGADPMTFHWLTITLELEAYILVSFGICVYALHLGRIAVRLIGKHRDEEVSWSHGFRSGFEALASATMYACLALALAALYEAVTLIALGASIAG